LESALTKACTIKIDNFEGPFDLLFHLIEKNKVNIYDIPINEITDQYMDYLYSMQEMDLEIASEFLVMAATLLHIKSKMLLPDPKEKQEEEVDPREELVTRLVEYRKYKDFSEVLKEREAEWRKLYYKLPEVVEIKREDEILELSPDKLRIFYKDLLSKNIEKINRRAVEMDKIIQHEKVTLRSKVKEITKILLKKTFFIFSEIFSLKKRSKVEVVTGFLAILELAKMKKVTIEQKSFNSDIFVYRNGKDFKIIKDEKIAIDG